MPSWLKHAIYLGLLVLLAGCAGSCSGCGGCGLSPLPGGFDPARRVENSTSIRVTDSGLRFISDNLGTLAPPLIGGQGGGAGGVLTFEVPTTSQSGFEVCKNGPDPGSSPPRCIVELDLARAKLDVATEAPHHIHVSGNLSVRIQDLPVEALSGLLSTSVRLGTGCSNPDFSAIGIDVRVSLEVDRDVAHAARLGYTKVVVEQLDINQGDLEAATSFCGGFLGTLASALKGLIFPLIAGQLTGPIDQAIEDQLCAKESPGAGVTCPTGTFPDTGGTCRYCSPDGSGRCPDSAADCVGLALGMDGTIDLSAALASISPGAKGGLDFLGALGGESPRDDGSGLSWGDLNPIANGMTIGMMGGAEPRPVTTCVPLEIVSPPEGVPIPDELTLNTVPEWSGDGPHVGLAVSERYINHAMVGAYDSGALCLGVGADLLGGLANSQTLSLLIPSLADLGRQRRTQQVALVLRPQKAPSLVVGGGTDLAQDPLLLLTLERLGIDFYVFASDRFLRAFTATFDLEVPVNLDVDENGALAPIIDAINVSNPAITNAPLLRESSSDGAQALADIVASQVGSQIAGKIKPIRLSDQLASYGLTLEIPAAPMPGKPSPGLRKLEKGSDRFLGIFASFGLATANEVVPPPQSETTAQVAERRVDPKGLVISTMTAANRPAIVVHASSSLDDGSRVVEYGHRIDRGAWKAWTLSRTVELSSPVLAVQGHHLVEVRSRVAGEPRTVDRTPAAVDVVIDVTPPQVWIDRSPHDGRLELQVHDLVSDERHVLVRVSLDDEPFTAWHPADEVPSVDVGAAASIAVQARDDEGNVAEVRQPIIRGRQDPTTAAGSGCRCLLARPGGSRPAAPVVILVTAMLGLAAARRRARRHRRSIATVRVTAAGMLALATSWTGCSCSDGSGDETSKRRPDGGTAGGGGAGGFPPSEHCPGEPQCIRIEPGLVGAYASAAVASDGTVWVAGYDDIGYAISNELGEDSVLFGDLVVGRWDGARVRWQTVDGLPPVDGSLEPGDPGGPPDPVLYDPVGFRFGLDGDDGDDVGLWTSIGVDGSDRPHVAYYDATHRALKYARREEGAWTVHTVDSAERSDVGRYAKLRFVGGAPIIAYRTASPGAGGAVRSTVRIATPRTPTPDSAGDWTFQDAATDDATPCRARFCADGAACRSDTLRCEIPISACKPACASGKSCFAVEGVPSCVDVLSKSFVDSYPEGIGLYLSVAETPSGLGMVYYDRTHGNLVQLRQVGGTWTSSILDGQADSADGPIDTGDVGIGAGLFVDDDGTWHVSYVDGFDETLVYLRVVKGTEPAVPEVVDDGVADGENLIVGDDSAIFVSAAGEVSIAYQDATNGRLRWARGTPKASGSGHDWTVRSIELPSTAGAFNQILELEGTTQVMTWWRRGVPRTEGDVVFVRP